MRILLLALAAGLSLLLLAPAPATAAETHESPLVQAADRRPLESASWHGRAIRSPHRHDADVRASGSGATGISRGTGYATPDGSQRVRTIQRRLRQLGYQPGPVDGRYGPRTEAALRWFEYKHGLESHGSVAAATVAHLRDRATGKSDRESRDVAGGTPPPERTTDALQPARQTADANVQQPRQHVDDTVISAVLTTVALLGVAVFFMAFTQGRAGAHRLGGPPGTPPERRPLNRSDGGAG